MVDLDGSAARGGRRTTEAGALQGLATALMAVILALGLLHALTYLCWFGQGCWPSAGIIFEYGDYFDLNAEQTVPNWFSSLLLAGIALTAWLTGAVATSGRRGWWALCVLFTYISLDEATELHGHWIKFMGGYRVDFVAHGFNWIIPGAVLVALIAMAFYPWTRRLPERTRRHFVLAGAIYVTGGLGMEALGAVTAADDFRNPAYLVISTVEEILEMAGAALMLMATLEYLRDQLFDGPLRD